MRVPESVLRAILLYRTVAPGAMTRFFEATFPIRSLSTSGGGRGPPEVYSIWWLEVSEPTGSFSNHGLSDIPVLRHGKQIRFLHIRKRLLSAASEFRARASQARRRRAGTEFHIPWIKSQMVDANVLCRVRKSRSRAGE